MNWREAEEQFALLPLREQMRVLERLFRRMRRDAYPEIDPAEEERLAMELANEPNLNAPYVFPEGTYSENQLKPRGAQ
jgi:hypothetical protein